MNFSRNTVLVALVVLQSCTFQPYEKSACRGFEGHAPLASLPENVELLYSLEGFGKPRAGYHEHWYELSDNTLAACRHPKAQRSGCGTEEIEFVKTRDGWEISKPLELMICASATASR